MKHATKGDNPRIAWHLPTLAGAAALALASACSDLQPFGVEHTAGPIAPGAPLLAAFPIDGYALNRGAVAATIGNSLSGSGFFAADVSSIDVIGHPAQVALSTTSRGPMPTDGGSYLVISSGDARTLGNTSVTDSDSCGEVDAGKTLCDVGGIEIGIDLPGDATNVDFDYVYFTSEDPTLHSDPARVFLVTPDGQQYLLLRATTQGEIGTPGSGAFRLGALRRHSLSVDPSWRNNTIRLRFLASDEQDRFSSPPTGTFDSGILLDNVRVSRGDNVRPLASGTGIALNPLPINFATTLSATVSDAAPGGIAYAWYQIDGGAWTQMGGITGNPSVATATANIAPYSAAQLGVYQICVRAQDAQGNYSPIEYASCVDLAVYDPAEGYVTGSGSIDSPAGAYRPDPAVYGPAAFAFSSKYRKGSNVPDGSTRFTFRAANFEFKSTIYQWLVVSGAKAQFKGSGTINGIGDYGFMLTAIDGDIQKPVAVDKFRIKIWEKNGDGSDGPIVYDNELNVSDKTDPTTAIASGKVMISK